MQVLSPQDDLNLRSDDYFAALETHLRLMSSLLPDRRVGAVYFGGGTPNLLSTAHCAGLLEMTFRYFTPLTAMADDCLREMAPMAPGRAAE